MKDLEPSVEYIGHIEATAPVYSHAGRQPEFAFSAASLTYGEQQLSLKAENLDPIAQAVHD